MNGMAGSLESKKRPYGAIDTPGWARGGEKKEKKARKIAAAKEKCNLWGDYRWKKRGVQGTCARKGTYAWK